MTAVLNVCRTHVTQKTCNMRLAISCPKNYEDENSDFMDTAVSCE